LGYLTRKIIPDMTYNVFGGALNCTQSINQVAARNKNKIKQKN